MKEWKRLKAEKRLERLKAQEVRLTKRLEKRRAYRAKMMER